MSKSKAKTKVKPKAKKNKAKSKVKPKVKVKPKAKARAKDKAKTKLRPPTKVRPKTMPRSLIKKKIKAKSQAVPKTTNKNKPVISHPPAAKKAIARWGILGGLFNPIHKGHLFIAQEAYQRYFLEKIVFVPCGQPPHKSPKDIASAEDRVNMVKKAIAPYPYFSVSRTEIDRQGPSYALDTIREMKFVPGREGSRDIFFVIGLDAFLEIKSWHKFKDCLNLVRWVVFNRAGLDQEKIKQFLKKSPLKEFATRVYQVKANPPAIAARDLRKMIKKRKDISAFVPASVAAYIKENKLYRK